MGPRLNGNQQKNYPQISGRTAGTQPASRPRSTLRSSCEHLMSSFCPVSRSCSIKTTANYRGVGLEADPACSKSNLKIYFVAWDPEQVGSALQGSSTLHLADEPLSLSGLSQGAASRKLGRGGRVESLDGEGEQRQQSRAPPDLWRRLFGLLILCRRRRRGPFRRCRPPLGRRGPCRRRGPPLRLRLGRRRGPFRLRGPPLRCRRGTFGVDRRFSCSSRAAGGGPFGCEGRRFGARSALGNGFAWTGGGRRRELQLRERYGLQTQPRCPQRYRRSREPHARTRRQHARTHRQERHGMHRVRHRPRAAHRNCHRRNGQHKASARSLEA